MVRGVIFRFGHIVGAGLIALAVSGGPVQAIERFSFNVIDTSDPVERAVRAASLLFAANEAGTTSTQEIFAAARADYERILGVLYGRARYGATVSIQIDGVEAADIPLTEVPAVIRSVVVRVDPRNGYVFNRADIGPLAPGDTPSERYAVGQIAETGEIANARSQALESWFAAGRALAETASERFVADHAAETLDARIRIAPGPVTRFGDVRVVGTSSVREQRILEIAGFPTGEIITPQERAKVTDRLRRIGTFSSVLLTQRETLGPGNTLDYDLEVVDQQPRRLGFGAELSSTDGVSLSALWMHRNIFGGAETFRIEGEIDGISGSTGGADYALGARVTRPATVNADTDAFAFVNTNFDQEPDYEARTLSFGVGTTRRFSEVLTGEAAVRFVASEEEDALGERSFRFIGLPITATWERRDDILDPTRGRFTEIEVEPYLGLNGTTSGIRLQTDRRLYFPLGDRIVLAGRLQTASVFGPSLTETPNDFRTYSGGGGTVRGQNYQSLGVDLGGGVETGGKSFAAISVEARAQLRGPISVVGFFDVGYVSEDSLFAGTGEMHSGAGIGVRYATGIGPIRLDLAVPVEKPTPADDFYLYIGIGQAF